MNAKKELFLSKEALMLKHDFDDRAYRDQRGVQDLQSIGEEALMGKKLEMDNFTNMVDYRADNEKR